MSSWIDKAGWTHSKMRQLEDLHDVIDRWPRALFVRVAHLAAASAVPRYEEATRGNTCLAEAVALVGAWLDNPTSAAAMTACARFNTAAVSQEVTESIEHLPRAVYADLADGDAARSAALSIIFVSGVTSEREVVEAVLMGLETWFIDRALEGGDEHGRARSPRA
jgi:hypothetical protein